MKKDKKNDLIRKIAEHFDIGLGYALQVYNYGEFIKYKKDKDIAGIMGDK